MYIPKNTMVSVKVHQHVGIAIGVLATDYEAGGEVNLQEFRSPIPAPMIKSVTVEKDQD